MIQFALIMALLGAGVLLLAMMALQNHMLRRSHRRQTAIAEQNAFLASHDVLTELPNRKSSWRRCRAPASGRPPTAWWR